MVIHGSGAHTVRCTLWIASLKRLFRSTTTMPWCSLCLLLVNIIWQFSMILLCTGLFVYKSVSKVGYKLLEGRDYIPVTIKQLKQPKQRDLLRGALASVLYLPGLSHFGGR